MEPTKKVLSVWFRSKKFALRKNVVGELLRRSRHVIFVLSGPSSEV